MCSWQISAPEVVGFAVDVAVAAVAAAAVVAVVDAAVIVVAVVGLQRISGGLWRLHWGDGYCCGAEKGL